MSLIKVIEQRLRSRRHPAERCRPRRRPRRGSGRDSSGARLRLPVPARAVPPRHHRAGARPSRRARSTPRRCGRAGPPPSASPDCCSASRRATKEAALSPVADIFAVAGADGAIRLWELRTRNRVGTLRTELHQRTRPRRRRDRARLLARRLAARLRARRRRRAPLGHVDGERGAGEAPARRVGRRARVLAGRRHARDRLARRQPAPVRRGRGARGRGPARADTPAHRRHGAQLGRRRRVDPDRALVQGACGSPTPTAAG